MSKLPKSVRVEGETYFVEEHPDGGVLLIPGLGQDEPMSWAWSRQPTNSRAYTHGGATYRAAVDMARQLESRAE